MVQSQLENTLVQVRNSLKLIERLRGMTHVEKRQFMQRAAQGLGSDTFKVSYVGRMDWGAVEPYIQRAYTYVDVLNSGIMVEIQAANGSFDFCFLQEFSEDIYVRRFMELLDQEGIPATISDPSPLMIAGMQLECP